jgi:polysaccharide biosynthesis protein PelA
MRPILFLMFSSLGAVLATTSYGMQREKFAVYYSDQAPIEHFSNYQLLVLDRKYHPPLQPLAEKGKMLLGYVSLGEIETTSPYFEVLKRHGLVLEENKNWPGSHFADLRDPLWHKIVIENIIPAVLRDGFNGVFFDTLDSPLEMERRDPAKYGGMSEAAIRLIEAVRLHYPQAKIMVNRAYPILPRIAPKIDMVLGESMLSDYDFDKKTYVRVTDVLYQQQVPWLEEAKRHNPGLKIYTLDYADTKDQKAIADIYRQQRAKGFIPYVASIELDELVDEPGI